jgi:hypothetical protein
MDDKSEEQMFLVAIEQDVETGLEILNKDDTPYDRRMFVKNYYSFIEGFLHFLRYKVIKEASGRLIALTSAEIAVLKEESYSVDGRGAVP